jgi:flavin reductase (DIM6/NTAB) family NADH-FMN oxidoreductase RutF
MTDTSTTQSDSHVTSEPAILYFGTPVVLISTVNQDGSYNLAPMSSAFWLGWRCIIGLAAASKTTENLKRTRQCVLNLPSSDQVATVDRLALTTGSDPVPEGKCSHGYRTEKAKFALAGLTPMPAETVDAPRAMECPVQLEAVVPTWHELAAEDEQVRGGTVVFELRMQRVHLARAILLNGDRNHVDPDKWHPLIMSFQKFYRLAPEQVHPSTLARVPERLYRSPDVDRARAVAACYPASVAA